MVKGMSKDLQDHWLKHYSLRRQGSQNWFNSSVTSESRCSVFPLYLKQAFIYLHLTNNISQPLGTWIFMFNSFMNFTIRNYTKYSGKVRVVGTKDNWVVAVTIKICITNKLMFN